MDEQAQPKAQKAYEVFKLQWMINHDFSLTDLVECMDIMVHEDQSDSGVRTSLQSLFEDWEFGVGFVGGQIWPCYEEFKQNEYVEKSENTFLLISVYERNICTEGFSSIEAARDTMLDELKTEYLKGNSQEKWDEIINQEEYECDEFGFGRDTAWSNLDDDCNCDWRIITLPPAITE